MSDLNRLTGLRPTPTGLVRAVTERLDACERELRAARMTLAGVEAALLTTTDEPDLIPEALTTDQVARLLSLSRSTVTAMIGRHELASGPAATTPRATLDRSQPRRRPRVPQAVAAVAKAQSRCPCSMWCSSAALDPTGMLERMSELFVVTRRTLSTPGAASWPPSTTSIPTSPCGPTSSPAVPG